MKNDISKLCADSLRSYLNDKHDIKLKSGLAHEIVAAIFGYKSKAALLADTQYSLSNLDKAAFILLTPPTAFVNQRLKSLNELPPNLPPSSILAEGIYPVITSNQAFLKKVKPTFRDLAISLAGEKLDQHVGHLIMSPTPQWITDVRIETTEAEVLLTVTFYYPTEAEKRHRYCTVDIKLPRIAGNIGYGTPEVMPTFYSGKFRDPDYNPKFEVPLSL